MRLRTRVALLCPGCHEGEAERPSSWPYSQPSWLPAHISAPTVIALTTSMAPVIVMRKKGHLAPLRTSRRGALLCEQRAFDTREERLLPQCTHGGLAAAYAGHRHQRRRPDQLDARVRRLEDRLREAEQREESIHASMLRVEIKQCAFAPGPNGDPTASSGPQFAMVSRRLGGGAEVRLAETVPPPDEVLRVPAGLLGGGHLPSLAVLLARHFACASATVGSMPGRGSPRRYAPRPRMASLQTSLLRSKEDSPSAGASWK